MSILILSDIDDGHIPFVTRHLDEKPIIIGSRGIIDNTPLDIIADQHGSHVHYDSKEFTIPKSVWYRKPYLALQELDALEEYSEYAHTAIKRHLDGLYTFLDDSFWVSHYSTVRIAESKPLQIQIAQRLGFRIPDTLFTSNKSAAQQFLDTHGICVVKTLAVSFPFDPKTKTAKMFFTRKIQPGEKIRLDGLNLAPAIFQEAIDPDFDIRVTVIDKKVFAASIRTKTVTEKFSRTLDWRAADISKATSFESFELPSDIAEKCIEHVRALGLRYGAIDLIQDKKGQIWFLENNPNGQWAFVEEATGQPIGKAMADLLQTHHV